MTTLNDEIDREVAKATELHNLKQAHERVHTARKNIENLRHLDLPDYIADDLRTLTSRMEDSEWRIESAVRGRQP